MPQLRPDPTFYPSPRLAMEAPPERLAYVLLLNPRRAGRPDAVGVVDVDVNSASCGQLVGQLDLPNVGDELHHFGWNACSSCLSPYAPHAHAERRYLIVPGIRSSRIHVIDTRPDPRRPQLTKVIEAETLADRTGYSRPHTVHCGPFGIYANALGSPSGEGPGGIFLMDPNTFEVLGRWEIDRGPQYLAYDFWWHLGYDTLVTSEWGTPRMIENGLDADLLLRGEYGHRLHFWDLLRRKHVQTVDLGAEHQMPLELRPAHDPTKAHGFVGVVISNKDLSGSVWTWHLRNGAWTAEKTITLPAEPADPALLPAALKPFKAVPPFVTDINLSLDDRFLYVSCWGTGELAQFDVSDPLHPRKTGSLRLGGVVGRVAHPSAAKEPLNGGPQMVEVSRDGRRIYLTNSLYVSWDDQLFTDGVRGWMAKANVGANGAMSLDEHFFLQFEGMRSHQVHLEGGDASSDSYCYP